MEYLNGLMGGWEISGIDIGVLAVYLLVMAGVGYICRKASQNVSDYIRMGSKGTWWLIGLSIFMQMVSAITFTANCGVAYLAGWSALWTSFGTVIGLLIQGFWLAGWMRKTRAVTPADTIRRRFSPAMEQIFVYIGVASSMLWGGVFLLGLANFISAAFNVPVNTIIIFAGIVVIFYSVSGGAWSVMITDSLQSMIMVPICIALAWLSLKAVGGFDGLLAGIQERGLSSDFQLLVEHGHEYSSSAGKIGNGYFTAGWVIASMLYAIIVSSNMTGCYRYLAAKTCRDAHKAAFFAAALIFVGMFIWFIPPMVGRVLYEDEIEALAKQPVLEEQAVAEKAEAVGNDSQSRSVPLDGIPNRDESTEKVTAKRKSHAKLSNPADGAYALVAKKLLPPGLLGLIMIAMFAAAMSSLDSFLTGTAGLVGKNIYPPLARRMGWKQLSDAGLLRFTKGVNLALGVWAMWLAFYLNSTSGGGGIYEITLKIILLVGGPLGLPYALSFFVKKLPSWAPLVGSACGLMASSVFMFGTKWGWDWVGGLMWHQRMYISVVTTLVPTLLTSVFWKNTTQEYKNHVDEFFKLLKTPINFREEVGETDDHSQLKIVGGLGMLIAVLILSLIFFVSGKDPRIAVVFVAGFIGSISTWMYFAGRAMQKREHGRSVV